MAPLDGEKKMNMNKFKIAIEDMLKAGEKSLLTMIRARILTRLLKVLEVTPADKRVLKYLDFWTVYLRMPQTLKEGIGVYDLRDTAHDLLEVPIRKPKKG